MDGAWIFIGGALVALTIMVLVFAFAADNCKGFGLVPFVLSAFLWFVGLDRVNAEAEIENRVVVFREAGDPVLHVERVGGLRRVRVPLSVWESTKVGDEIKCRRWVGWLSGDLSFEYAGKD